MRNYVIRVSGSPRWSKPATLILKENMLYAVFGAMGIWDVKDTTAGVSSSANTSHARWYWDTHDGNIEIRTGFFDNKGDDTFENSELYFKFYSVSDLLRIGNYGNGNFYFAGKNPSTNVGWKVIDIEHH